MGNFAANYCVSTPLPSRPMDQHLIDASRNLVTLTFYLGDHGALALVGDSRSLCSICIPSLTFVGLPVRRILYTFGERINRPCDLQVDLLTSK